MQQERWRLAAEPSEWTGSTRRALLQPGAFSFGNESRVDPTFAVGRRGELRPLGKQGFKVVRPRDGQVQRGGVQPVQPGAVRCAGQRTWTTARFGIVTRQANLPRVLQIRSAVLVLSSRGRCGAGEHCRLPAVRCQRCCDDDFSCSVRGDEMKTKLKPEDAARVSGVSGGGGGGGRAGRVAARAGALTRAGSAAGERSRCGRSSICCRRRTG